MKLTAEEYDENRRPTYDDARTELLQIIIQILKIIVRFIFISLTQIFIIYTSFGEDGVEAFGLYVMSVTVLRIKASR